MSKKQTILAWVLTVLLAAVFGFAGAIKLIPTQEAAEGFAKLGYPGWFRVFVGICEVLGAVGLMIPRYSPETASFLLMLMIGAIISQFMADLSIIPPLVFMFLLAGHITLRAQEPT